PGPRVGDVGHNLRRSPQNAGRRLHERDDDSVPTRRQGSYRDAKGQREKGLLSAQGGPSLSEGDAIHDRPRGRVIGRSGGVVWSFGSRFANRRTVGPSPVRG